MHPCVHSSQDMETTWMSADKWMDEEDVVHMQWSTIEP